MKAGIAEGPYRGQLIGPDRRALQCSKSAATSASASAFGGRASDDGIEDRPGRGERWSSLPLIWSGPAGAWRSHSFRRRHTSPSMATAIVFADFHLICATFLYSGSAKRFRIACRLGKRKITSRCGFQSPSMISWSPAPGQVLATVLCDEGRRLLPVFLIGGRIVDIDVD